MPQPESPELTAEKLTELRLFAGESPDAIEWLLDTCERRRLPAGKSLLRFGQPNDKLYVVLNGRLAVRLSEEEEPIDYLGPGSCAGEMSIIERTNASAWVAADVDSECMVIDAANLWTLVFRSHTIAVNLLRILSERVRNSHQVIDRSRQLQTVFEHHAKVDALTGLYNRRWLDEHLAPLLVRCAEASVPLSAALIDVDNFKRYNDQYGHLAGDVALQTLAQGIRKLIPDGHVATRYGGEELLLLMPDTDLSQAEHLADCLCDKIRHEPIIDANGRNLPMITISIGVIESGSSWLPVDLIARADEAMYRAKQAGKDRYSL